MRRIITTLITIILFSCSSNNDEQQTPVDQNNEGNILKSYYTSNRVDEHFFENNGSRREKINHYNTLSSKYFYDENNKMLKIVEYNTNGANISGSILFYYDQLNRIEKIEKYTGSYLSEINLVSYDGNVITSQIVSDNSNPLGFNSIRTRYTLNNLGLLIKYEKFNLNQNTNTESIISYNTFIYDSNKNIISSKHSESGSHDLPDSNPSTTYTFSYTFDDKLNPLFEVYQNHYLNYILLQNKSFDFSFPYGTDFRDYSKNNFLNTIYPSNYPNTKYYRQLTYQNNNKLKTAKFLDLTDNFVTSINTFNYTN